MSDSKRGIMKFQDDNRLKATLISSALILGFIGLLLMWALGAAYPTTF